MSRLGFEMRLERVEAELLLLRDDDDDALVYEPPALSGPHPLVPEPSGIEGVTPSGSDNEGQCSGLLREAPDDAGWP